MTSIGKASFASNNVAIHANAASRYARVRLMCLSALVLSDTVQTTRMLSSALTGYLSANRYSSIVCTCLLLTSLETSCTLFLRLLYQVEVSITFWFLPMPTEE